MADPAETTILRPMTADEWPGWAAHIDRGYVEQMVEMGGMTAEAAEAKAAADAKVAEDAAAAEAASAAAETADAPAEESESE